MKPQGEYMREKICELLAPAGDEACAEAALDGGADAIYLGFNCFSARAGAANFSAEKAAHLLRRAHLVGAKGYLCLNTLIKEEELPAFFDAVQAAYAAGADAILVQDIFLGKRLKEFWPQLELHLSTQAGCCNLRGAELAKEYGFSRVVLARETPVEEIRAISGLIETEVFVQGALCTCFSGQCYLSSFAGNNSGNRGRCKQPCRKRYSIDRAGYEAPAFALSPSDLCVGERVKELLDAGVRSLKIEGRMRRREYVLAAVRYYRALLHGEEGKREFSDLEAAYNRGGYTQGLSFGQEKNFLSRKVQGHIGRRIGEISLRKGKYFCATSSEVHRKDAYKILRNGYEVGGAVFGSEAKGGFFLVSSAVLADGDEVRLTTDAAFSEGCPLPRNREIVLSLRFASGNPPEAVCGEFRFAGVAPLERAKNAPLSEEALRECFRRTDDLPFSVRFDRVETDGVFMARSALNAFRREFYAALTKALLPDRAPLPAVAFLPQTEKKKWKREEGRREIALLSADLTGLKADILVYKPADYRAISSDEVRKGEGKKYLYLPAFFTSRDEAAIIQALPLFEGVYCEGNWGISFARAHRKQLFAGTGFNLTNSIAAEEARRAGAKYWAVSKELNCADQRALADEGSFALTLGSVKVMDLCYCPFERTCSLCDMREKYCLRDEDGRKFPLRRYRAAEDGCRFEVYNCAPLAAEGGARGAIVDLTCEDPSIAAFALDPRGASLSATRGHSDRSMI